MIVYRPTWQKARQNVAATSRTSGGNCRQFFLLNSSLWTLFHEKMSREEDHKTLQEECKDAKVAFLRRRKIDRERRVHEVEGRVVTKPDTPKSGIREETGPNLVRALGMFSDSRTRTTSHIE